MSFVLGKIFWYLTQPGNLLLLLLVAGWLLLLAGARRAGHLLLALGLGAMLAVAVLPVGSWLLRPLEDRFPAAPAVAGRVDGIVVLGGSIDSWISSARDRPTLTEYADRMTSAAALARQHPEARILVTSGEAAILPEGVSEAPYMRRLLAELGIDEGRITIEGASRNTAENARAARRLVDPGPGERWLLVTSAFHMPRAVGCFRRLGWDVVPWPVDYKTTGRGGIGFGFNLRAGLDRVHVGLKEWMALVAYRLLDHTDTLFPGPAAS
ncbi:YdcF family protein [Stella sp.]|uniref:YdcF family protein n=1 Tax=Stella sp. TaxID=2912054 RepID=UPI0035B4DCE1